MAENGTAAYPAVVVVESRITGTNHAPAVIGGAFSIEQVSASNTSDLVRSRIRFKACYAELTLELFLPMISDPKLELHLQLITSVHEPQTLNGRPVFKVAAHVSQACPCGQEAMS